MKACIALILTLLLSPAAQGADISGITTHGTAVPPFSNQHRAVASPPAAKSAKYAWTRIITRDEETGEILPCRLTIADSTGQHWGPGEKMPEFRNFFHSSGDTLIYIDSGTYWFTVFRGNEYTPIIRKQIVISATSRPPVELTLKRWIHMKTLGWYSCDTEIHGASSLGLPGVYVTQLAEDLNILHLAAHGEGNWKSEDYSYWRTGPFPFSKPWYPLVIGEEWRSRTWQNHMIVMGHSRILSQYGNGYYEVPDCPFRFSYPPAADFCDEAHALGGIVFTAHTFPGGEPFTGDMSGGVERHTSYELPVDAALGKVDGMQVYSYHQSDTWNRFVWYKLLNCGFRVPPFAGSDVLGFTGTSYGFFPGCVRMYSLVPDMTDSLDVRAWMRAAAAGRSFVSSGAAVLFTVDGEPPGSELRFDAAKGSATVTVRAEARWTGGIGSVDIIVNGTAAISRSYGGAQAAVLDEKVTLTRSSWIAAKVNGISVDVLPGNAHSGPVYVTLDNRPIRSRDDALYFVKWIDRHIALLDSADHFDTAAHKDRTFALYRKAQDIYRARADTSIVTGISGENPRMFALHPNVPNPFNGETTVSFDLAASGRTSLVVHDILGRKVKTAFEGLASAGRHDIRISLDEASSGMYFLVLDTPGGRLVRKMLHVR